MKFSNNKKYGFTLIEMLVAVFVFSIIMTLATATIFNVVNANKTSQAIKSVMDNLSSAVDSMSRNIRYGTIYNCGNTDSGFQIPQSCSGASGDQGGTNFAFVERDGTHTVYTFAPAAIPNSANSIFKCTDFISTDNCIRLTATEVKITDMHFYVIGAMPDEAGQPEVEMTITGYTQNGTNHSPFNIETMVSERNLSCKNSVQIALGQSTCP